MTLTAIHDNSMTEHRPQKAANFLDLSVSEILYETCVIVYLLNYILFGTTPLVGPSGYATSCVLILLLVKIMITSFEERSRLIISAVIAVIGILSWMISGASQFLVVIAFILGARSVPPKHTALVIFWTILFGVSAILILCLIGVLPNAIFLQGMRTRHALGFTYVGMFDLYVLHLSCLLIYLKGASIKLHTVALFVALHLVAYSQSIVRGTLLVSLLVWGLYLLCVKRSLGNISRRLMSIASVCAIPVCLVIAVYTAVNYQPGSALWSAVNNLFTGRLMLSQQALSYYGIKPLGQTIAWVGSAAVQSGLFSSSQYNYVDSGYLQVLIQFGYVCLTVICSAYIAIAVHGSKTNQGIAQQIWVIAIAIESLIYPDLLLLAYNSLPLLASDGIFSSRKQRLACDR